MEEITFIDHTNMKWFWKHLNTEQEVDEVRKYLLDNNLKIEIRDYDTTKVDAICKVMLEGIDLSVNGYCFSGANLLLHIRYYRKIKAISETPEFKNWLDVYPLFDLIRRYAIEKRIQGIKEDELIANTILVGCLSAR